MTASSSSPEDPIALMITTIENRPVVSAVRSPLSELLTHGRSVGSPSIAAKSIRTLPPLSELDRLRQGDQTLSKKRMKVNRVYSKVFHRGVGNPAAVALFASIAAIALLSAVSAPESSGAIAGQQAIAAGSSRSSPPQFNCLPEGWKLNDVVSYKSNGKSSGRNITIEDKLKDLKAHCRQGKLVDSKGREIKFFRFSCFGNPPENYEEILQNERRELEKLQKDYTVIVPECDPRIS